jgi:uncharacterized protein YbaA (DUF1428 family)
LKEDEVVVFSWIIHKSKENRDRINKLVMEDPMMKNSDPQTWPFDGQRIFFAGFQPMIEILVASCVRNVRVV